MINKEIEQKILEILPLKTQKDIAAEFNVSQSYVSKLKNRYNIKISRVGFSGLIKKKVNEDFFKIIDSPKKAYWLGYLAADGCITSTHQKTALSSKDLEIIEKFKNDIDSEHKITSIDVYDNRTDKAHKRYSLQVTNNLFTEHLCKWGVNENKSHVFSFPAIDEKFYSYFIAGLFDGDGSVYLRPKRNELRCNLISTYEVLSFIQEYFFKKLNILPKVIIPVSKNTDNVYKVCWLTMDTLKILNYIYGGDENIYLSRKYALYEQHKLNKPSRHRINIIQELDYNGKILNTYYGLNSAAKHMGIHETTLFRLFKKNNGKFEKNGHIWQKEK